MRVILATRNQSKLEEVQNIFFGSNIEIVGMAEVGAVGEAKEDGTTLFDNACKKARFVRSMFPQYWVAADDSGLFVEALSGRPGVHSARWMGEQVTTEEITHFILKKMARVPMGKRQAYMETVSVLFSPEPRQDFFFFSDKIKGEIAIEIWGLAKPGMPYDPVFIPDGRDRSFGETPVEVKNTLSHRSKAFTQMRDFLVNIRKYNLV